MLRTLREHWLWIAVTLALVAVAIAVAAWCAGDGQPGDGVYPIF